MAPSALRDLGDIYDHIPTSDTDIAADFTRRILDHIAKLATLGHGGVARDRIALGIRLSVFGTYGIYFRQDAERLTVLRVLHGRRNIAVISMDEDDPAPH